MSAESMPQGGTPDPGGTLIVAWTDSNTAWLTHRAPKSGTHALMLVDDHAAALAASEASFSAMHQTWQQAAEIAAEATARAEAAEQSLSAMQARVDGLEADAARYRLVREEGRDLGRLLALTVGLNPGGHGTYVRALRHTHQLDEAIDAAIAAQRQESTNGD